MGSSHCAPKSRRGVRRLTHIALAVALVTVSAPASIAGAQAAEPTTWTVTSSGDAAGVCAPGDCTLRAAIAAADSSAGADRIVFAIPPFGPQTIAVGGGAANPLPAVTGNDIEIDGTTQPGGGDHGIRLDDPDTGDNESGLVIQGQRATIRGLALTRWDRFGIQLTATALNAVIVGNWVGTGDGVTSQGTGDDGIRVTGGGGDRIGGSSAADRNVISGSKNDGLEIQGSSDNVVTGNYAGLAADGATRMPNADTGIEINGVSLRNRIGGTTAAERNVVSGNSGIGIQLLGSVRTDGTCASPEQNVVVGNWSGLTATGTKPVKYGNQGAGIELGVCARNNQIGGTGAGEGNVSSGNHDDGIQLDGNGGPGGTGAVCGNTIAGNYVGLDPTGRLVRPNVDDGIDLDRGACNNVVTSNVIAGNQNDGIDLHERNANGATTTGNQLVSNFIGVAADGRTVVQNLQNGVHIRFASTGNTVERNVISGNGFNGVLVETSAARSNTIVQNSIGLSADGTTVIGNGQSGVRIFDGSRLNRVEANRIVRSGGAGIAVEATSTSTTTTDGNRLTQNVITGSGGLAIDLLPTAGVNANDGTTSTAVGNLGIDYPVISAATAAAVKGTAPPNSTVEVFEVPPDSDDGNGETARYLGSADAGSNGAWCLPGLSVTTPTVTATATDAAGDTSETAVNVPATGSDALCGTPTPVVDDTFERVVTGGWGSTGAFTWTHTGTLADFAVDGQVGSIRQSAAGTRTAALAVAKRNVNVLVKFRMPSLPASGWAGFYAVARQTSSSNWYGVRVRSVAGASDDIELERSTTDGGLVRVGAAASVPELVAGAWYWLRLEATGDGTTTSLRGRVWQDGAAESTGKLVTADDATTALQGTGGVGVRLVTPSTGTPAAVEVDEFSTTTTD